MHIDHFNPKLTAKKRDAYSNLMLATERSNIAKGEKWPSSSERRKGVRLLNPTKELDLTTGHGMTGKEVELCSRVIRQAPVMMKALQDAENRSWAATHPNAVALRKMIHSALRGLEEPLSDDLRNE
jgi:hypothetical protein